MGVGGVGVGGGGGGGGRMQGMRVQTAHDLWDLPCGICVFHGQTDLFVITQPPTRVHATGSVVVLGPVVLYLHRNSTVYYY